MASQHVLRTVAIISTVSSLVQSLVWSMMSLLALMCYGCHLTPMSFGTKSDITQYLVAYFQGSSCQSSISSLFGSVTTSTDRLLLLQVLVLVFNLLLAIASVTSIIAIAGKKTHVINGWLIFYLATGFCVAVLDGIVSWPFANDLRTISNSEITTSKEGMELTLLVLLLISTRFFVFWGFNVALLIGLVVCLASNVNCSDTVETKWHQRRKSTPTFREAVKCSVCNRPPSFQFDSRDLDQAAEYIRPKATDYPPHTAFSRWPQLNPNNRTSRPASSPEMTMPSPSQSEAAKYSNNQRYQPPPPHQHQNPHTNPEPPRPPPLKTTVIAAASPPSARRNQPVRPNSLQEAIMTVRPLRRTRPGIASQ